MNQAASAQIVRKGGRPLAGPDEARLVDLIVISVSVCVAGSLVGGAPGLALTSTATLLATWFVLRIGGRILPASFCFRILVYIYGSQILIQLLLALTGKTICPSGGWGMDLTDHSGTIALSEILLLAGTLLAAVVWGWGVRGKHSQFVDLRQCPPSKARFAIVIALLLHISQPIIGMFLPDSLSWMLSVLMEDFEAAAFFVGWFAEDIGPVANRVVLAALLVNCAIGGLRGTRYPILLLALYLIGRLVSPRERHRRRIVYASLAAAVPMVFAFSMVGQVRVLTGHESQEFRRESLRLLAPSRWGGFIQTAVALHEYQATDTSTTGSVLSRLYAWPNAASVILTPDPVPYRGFARWVSECGSYLQIGTWSSEAREQFAQEGHGTSHASDYGFLNIPGATSEFGVLADGWSTAGPVGVFTLGFLLTLVLCMSEHLVLYSIDLSYMSKLLFLCILIKACIQCYVYPAPMVIRYVVLYSCFWIVVLKIVDALCDYRHRASRHRNAISSGPRTEPCSPPVC